MSRKAEQVPEWATAFPEMYHVFSDFILSRKAISCSDRTIFWYLDTLEKILGWMTRHGVDQPLGITAKLIRAYIAELVERKLSDNYVHNHARVLRTFIIFLAEEKYIPERIKFKMPSVERQRLLCPTASDIERVLKACEQARDKALILTMVDTGARAAETLALNWGDIDINTGLVHIARGKGGKPRSVVVGVTTRRALLAYRRELNPEDKDPLFQTDDGQPLKIMGLRSLFLRLEQRSGVEISPHAMRRAFATMSWRAGMDPLELQALLGHTTLIMVNRYIQMVDDDLVEAHRQHGPIDNLVRRNRGS